MAIKLKFKVAMIDHPTLQKEDPVVSIEVEPARWDKNVRSLVRHAINCEPDLRDLSLTAETMPINYWSGLPMDVCRGYFGEGGIHPSGHYEGDKWIPDYIVAKEPTFEALVEALIADQDAILSKLGMPGDDGE
jgi:hypothetical protein